MVASIPVKPRRKPGVRLTCGSPETCAMEIPRRADVPKRRTQYCSDQSWSREVGSDERLRRDWEIGSFDGNGTIRRCHFIRDVIGNLYETAFEEKLFARPCTN